MLMRCREAICMMRRGFAIADAFQDDDDYHYEHMPLIRMAISLPKLTASHRCHFRRRGALCAEMSTCSALEFNATARDADVIREAPRGRMMPPS